MKSKLLKKVRKRFYISHLPDGYFSYGNDYKQNLFRLTDKESSCYKHTFCQLGVENGKYCNDIFYAKQECINFLLAQILKTLKEEGYKTRKMKSIENNVKKVWYENN